MPISKKRKDKKGKPVKRGDDRLTHLTLQDLINVVAYQDAHPEEAERGGAVEIVDENEDDNVIEVDFSDPDTQAVIRAVNESNIDKMEEDTDGGN